MKRTVKSILMGIAAAVVALGFVACSKDDEAAGSLKGKWLLMTDNNKVLLVINADHTFFTTGAMEDTIWASVEGKIILDGDNITLSTKAKDAVGTYKLADDKLTLNIGGETFVYNKLLEKFSLEGSWKCVNTLSFIKAVKDELTLPFGSIVNGSEIPTVVKTANIKGEFVEKAIEAYFRNVEFKENGKMTYKVVKNGQEEAMTKNYVLDNNMLRITGRVGSVDVDNQFMAFQNPNKQQSFLFLTKENIADMFVGYGFMLREGNISEGSNESLEAFREEFIETFENFATIIYLEKQ